MPSTNLIDVERDAAHLDLTPGLKRKPLSVVARHVEFLIPFGSWSARCSTRSQCRLLWRRRLSRAARAPVAGLHRLPRDMCVKKTAPGLTCPAASRRRMWLMSARGRRCAQCGRPFRIVYLTHRIHMRIQRIPPWRNRRTVSGVTDTIAGQASIVQNAIFCCEREC